jgi:hypothetical protein
MRTWLLGLLLLLLLPMADATPSPAVAVSSACLGAAMPTNAVVHYYLALDERRFAAAYGCFSPAEQARLPYATWAAGYWHTLRSRLMLADSGVPNGSPARRIAVRLYAEDRRQGRLMVTIYQGSWHVDRHNRLAGVSLHAAPAPATTPAFDPPAILGRDGRVILEHRRLDITGGGASADDVYLTSGAGCASCHAQQIWIYSRGRLIFQQQVDDADLAPLANKPGMEIVTDTPGSPGLDSCCPTEKTHELWLWTPQGFVLRGTRVTHHGG